MLSSFWILWIRKPSINTPHEHLLKSVIWQSKLVGYAIGLLCKECAQIGVIIKASIPGDKIEPPDESEYAVEPFCVAIITPSPSIKSTSLLSILTEILTILS